MKKKLLMALSYVLVVALAITGTIAYLTDTDSEVNVMTMGNVDIEQVEQERNATGTLVGFTQEKPAIPAVTADDSAWAPNTPVKIADGMWVNMYGDKVANDIDKIVTVKNTGKNAAYVRTIIAVESVGENDWHLSDMMAGYYTSEADAQSKQNKVPTMVGNAWDQVGNVEINGVNHYILVATYKDPLAAGATSAPSMTGIALDDDVTSEQAAKYGDTWNILALSQAVQADGFSDATTALTAGFGEVTAAKAAEWFADVRPEVSVDGANNAALLAAIEAANEGDAVVLENDVTFSGTSTLTIDKAIVLDLNGHTLTTSGTYGGIIAKGGCSIKNGTINHTATVAAIKAFQIESIEDVTVVLDGKSSSNNAITGISVQEGSNTYIGSLKNVKVISTGDNKIYNGIETHNCGARTDYAIGSMENVTVDVNGTALLLSAPAGTATKCSFMGGVCGINAHLKGTYNVSLNLVDSAVESKETAVHAWDEPAADKINSGYLKLEAENTIVNGKVVIEASENFGDRWVVTGF